LAALECVEAIVASGRRPRRPIEVVSWTNEEGTRFLPSVMGSSAFARARRLEDMTANCDESGVRMGAALDQVLKAEAALPRRPIGFPAAAYLEAHIEQGPILEQASKTIGLVTGIYGKLTFQVEVTGEANHAATTPRNARRDALATAGGLVHALQSLWERDEFIRFTIGTFNVYPNQAFVIPGRVAFHIDIRHPDTEALSAVGKEVQRLCGQAAGRCQVSARELVSEPSLSFDRDIQERFDSAVRALEVPSMRMGSAAWHDSVFLNRVCPTGMIFIPCKNGVSHNEAESASKEDVIAGTCVLAEAAFATANSI
jgi:N-carbamoyl-L-amino-acid hydrolase